MNGYFIDSDAWNFLLTHLLERTKVPLLLTQFVARKELSQLYSSEIEPLVRSGRIRVEAVKLDPKGRKKLEALRKVVHIGEAEAIAWLSLQGAAERPSFISCDVAALAEAKKSKVPALDLMGLVAELVASDLLPLEQAKAHLVAWEDKKTLIGKPPDYDGFDSTLARRLAARTSRLESNG